ncbi:MAG TPA: phosphoenolpyruvate carboxylase, partial [Pelomicrobium sp.]|nr:phosphoenolpyruvate carboxylase [Pelomicrobium sp.]
MNPPLDDPASPDKDAPLREDIRLLGRILGDTLRDQEGDDAFELIESIRRTAVRFHRDEDADARHELEATLNAVTDHDAILVVRAFSYFSQLMNIAEDQHHNRRRRAHLLAGSPPQEGTVGRALARLREAGVGPERIAAFFRDALIAPVLTAHPTEVQRQSILDRQLEIARLVAERSRDGLAPFEQAENEEAMRRAVLTLWQTRMLRLVRLNVEDEIDNGLAYFRSTFLTELPRLYAEIEDALAAAGHASAGALPRFLFIGSWIGGDRDGNPFVTADKLRHAAREHSALAFDFLLGETHKLGSELSLATRLVDVTPELTRLAEASHDTAPSRADELYRRALIGIYARLTATARAHGHTVIARFPLGDAAPYDSAQAFIDDLDVMIGSLRRHGSAPVARGRIRSLRCAATVFGFHLAPIDLRQHSGVHEQVVAELLARAGGAEYGTLDESARRALLAQELAGARLLSSPFAQYSETVKSELAILRAAAEVQE